MRFGADVGTIRTKREFAEAGNLKQVHTAMMSQCVLSLALATSLLDLVFQSPSSSSTTIKHGCKYSCYCDNRTRFRYDYLLTLQISKAT